MTSDPETCPHCHFASPIDDWECMGGMSEIGDDLLFCPTCGLGSTHQKRQAAKEGRGTRRSGISWRCLCSDGSARESRWLTNFAPCRYTPPRDASPPQHRGFHPSLRHRA